MQVRWGDTIDYAANRWARAVVTVTPLTEDVTTLAVWARASHSSVGALRAICRAARTPAKASLDFARSLRVVLHGQSASDWDPANLFNARHERTLARLLKQGGLEQAARRRHAPAVHEFLSSQSFVVGAANLRAVGLELAKHLEVLGSPLGVLRPETPGNPNAGTVPANTANVPQTSTVPNLVTVQADTTESVGLSAPIEGLHFPG